MGFWGSKVLDAVWLCLLGEGGKKGKEKYMNGSVSRGGFIGGRDDVG